MLQRWAKKLNIPTTHANDGNGTHVYVTEPSNDDGLGGNLSLLNTIKLPKNLKLLTDRLPKSKYEEDGTASVSGSTHKGGKNLLHESSSVKSIKTIPDKSNKRSYRKITKVDIDQ